MQKRALAAGAPKDKVHSIVNTPLKRQVYEDLMRQPGLTREEVLREIVDACSGGREDEEVLDADMLMFNIVTRREQEQIVGDHGHGVDWEALQEEALKQREDADMDRAILESEQERDVIQSRKRSRVSELRTDAHCSIGAARRAMRSSSVLREEIEPHPINTPRGINGAVAKTNASPVLEPISTSSSSCVDLTTDSSEEDEAPTVSTADIGSSSEPCAHRAAAPRVVGSRVLQSVVRLLDSGATNSEPLSSCSSSSASHSGVDPNRTIWSVDTSSSTLTELRAEVVQLLMLEADALKYHRQAGVPYLTGLAQHVDATLNTFAQLAAGDESAASFHNDHLGVRCAVPALLKYLKFQSRKLQRALYKLPQDGHLVPLLFRKTFRDKRLSADFHNSMAEDGFELLEEDEGDDGGDEKETGRKIESPILRVAGGKSVYSEEEEESESEDDSCGEDSGSDI
eukprot:gene32500-40110_t